MATYPQFGHPPTLPPSQLLTSAAKPGSNGSSPEPVRASAPPGMSATPISVPPGAAQGPYAAAVPYNPALLAYPRLPGLSESMYGAASLAASTQGIYTLGTDPAAFYVNPITGTPYDLKDNAEIWRNLAQPTACLPYDPATLAAYPYAGYGGIDLSLAARRKNATKENTSTLKAWLGEHKKNPYPTKGEKIMLAIITKMTLTQVSTWFANARRRLKKENKMTWSPKSKEDGSDDEGDNDENPDVRQNEAGNGDDSHNDSLGKDGDHTQVDVLGCDSDDEDNAGDDSSRLRDSSADRLSSDLASQREASSPGREGPLRKDNDDTAGRTSPTQRPRIWSLDDVLGPTRSSSPPRSQHSPSAPAYTTSTLPFPMPLKPTATSLPMGLSHTAASLRHWAERGPYSIPPGLATSMAHHYGLSAGILTSAGGGPVRPGHAAMSFPGLPQAHLPQHGSMGALGGGGSAVHPAMHAAGAGAASMAGPLGHAPHIGLLTTSQSTSPIRLSPPHQHPLRNGIANGPSPRTPESDRSQHSPPPSFTAFRPVPRSKPTDVVKV